jgi:hypothetical protein
MQNTKTPRITQISRIHNLFRICGIRGIRGVFVFALLIQASYGQAIKGEVIAGFGGYYRIGKCMPVKVNLENSGADLTGEISILISRTTFTQAVSLPSPSKKTYVFYVAPPKYFQDLEVKLFSEGKLLNVFAASVHRVSDDERLVLKSSTLKPFSLETSSPPAQKEKVAFLDPQDFPESWADYEAVNSIILDDSDVIRLNETQRGALSRWTKLGGGATLFNRDKESSIRNPLGLGSFGGIDKQAQSEEAPYQPSLLDLDEEIFKALRIREPIPHAGTVWPLSGFLLLYGLAIVFCLWMSRKPGSVKTWSYVALPACAILFSALSPLTSQVVNGGKALVRQYSVNHVFANSMDAFATYDLSLIFPSRGEVKLSPAIQSPFIVQGESDNSTDPIHYEFEGKGTPAAIFNTNMGSTKLISLSGFSNRSPFLVLHDMDSFTLANKSKSALHDCTLIRNGVSAMIGDIPTGKEIRLKSSLDASGSEAPAGRSHYSNMLSKTIDVYETETLAGSTGDCVICAMDVAIPSLKDDNLGLSYRGSTAVIYHLGKHRNEESDLVKQ